MKNAHQWTATIAMFFLIPAILIGSFWVGIYGDSHYRFYEKEYETYAVTEDLDMKLSDVMDVTRYMMDYLIGKEDTLSIVTTVEGRRQDFFNDQDRAHMADVRNLFLGGLTFGAIFLITGAALLAFLAFKRAELTRLLFRAYAIGLSVFLLIAAVLGGLFASNFTKYFTIFHEIFFTNDLWIFDPATDYMIRMLPEGFFYDMVMRIGSIFVGSLVIIGIILFVWKRRGRKAHK